ncbi:twin-arginine translocase TatA/TatE family subunit [Candidatus Marinamargulisbacteria bacterium SCGC AG-343-D04]|nr:twin-arginine translocase TatA/TatE family subunit [Candidatus Marinamargulisbacteria bacterium SCGC AG-343-D04]
MFGSKEIIVIAVIILVLFGSAAIPKFAKSLGLAKKEFEKGLKEAEEEGSEKDTDSKKST